MFRLKEFQQIKPYTPELECEARLKRILPGLSTTKFSIAPADELVSENTSSNLILSFVSVRNPKKQNLLIFKLDKFVCW